MILPKHVFEPYKGAKSREAPANLKPVGTGPYRFVDFKPGDLVRGRAQPRLPRAQPPVLRHASRSRAAATRSRPRARSCRPASTTTPGTCRSRTTSSSAWSRAARARSPSRPAADRAHPAQPDRPVDEVDGERSSAKTTHPFLTDPAVRAGARPPGRPRRRSRSRSTAAQGRPPPTSSTRRTRFRSQNTRWEFNVDKANQLLDAGGLEARRRRHPGQGRQAAQDALPDLDQRAAQKIQADHQAGRGKAGIEMELKSVVASVVLLLRPRQPRHLHALLRRPPDVRPDGRPPDPAAAHAGRSPPGRWRPRRTNGTGRNIVALAQRGVRPALRRRRDRDGPGQARGHVHPHERPRGPERIVIPLSCWRNWVSDSVGNKLKGTDISGWDC